MVKFYSENLHHSKGILKTKRCNKTCPNCNKDFTIRETIKQTYCSKSCELEYKEKHRDEYIQYVNECKFNFSISDFPDEFNTTLIEKYGWYSAANRGNNLLGVSRDHMYSVKRGFENSVDPKYISHPANCELMRHDYNNKKNYNCSITVNELMDRVRKWDLKYKCVGDRIGQEAACKPVKLEIV